MAVLAEQDRFDLWAEWMRENLADVPIDKNQLREVFNAADDWAEANTASYNSAIPQPQRGLLSNPVKASILVKVIERRWKVGA